MQSQIIADVFLGLLALVQGAATLRIDLARTHATNPDWPGHARFHVVWQFGSVAALTVLTEITLWSHALPEVARFHLALAITLVPMVSYVGALLFVPVTAEHFGTETGCRRFP